MRRDQQAPHARSQIASGRGHCRNHRFLSQLFQREQHPREDGFVDVQTESNIVAAEFSFLTNS